MSRYIECSAIEKDLEERYNYYRKESEIKVGNMFAIDEKMQTAAIIAKHCLDQIKEAPTADVVEVVRCKDCKWCEDLLMSGLYCNHPDNRNPIHCLPTDFCNCGERREE